MLAVIAAIVVTSASASAQPKEGAAAVDPQAKERSRAAFRRGVAQLRAQEWAAARASFEEAWSLVQHPSILLNLGIARLKTDDPVLAEADLVRFLSEDSGAASDEVASAREALAEARSKIGTLRVVTAPPTARVMIDGKAAGNREGTAEARVKAGEHTLAIDADGFVAEERTVSVAAKDTTEVRVSLVAKAGAPAPPTEAPTERERGPATRTIVGWSLAGVGAGALLATTVMGLRAISLSSDYEDPNNTKSFQNKDVKDEGIAFRTGADVALVIAILAGASAAVLLLTDIGASKDPSVSTPSPHGASRAAIRLLSHRPLISW